MHRTTAPHSDSTPSSARGPRTGLPVAPASRQAAVTAAGAAAEENPPAAIAAGGFPCVYSILRDCFSQVTRKSTEFRYYSGGIRIVKQGIAGRAGIRGPALPAGGRAARG